MPDERPPSSLEEKRARLARALARRAVETVEAPLSFAQEPLWFADQLDPGSPLFNITLSVRVRGPLSEGFVRRAMVAAVARHEPLRTTFAARNGVPVQRIAPTATPELRFLSLADLAGDGLADRVERFVRAETRARFDLSKGPLLRTAMVRLAPEDHLVAFTVHHIVADGWSVGVLLQEIATAFARESGRPVAPPPTLTLQLRDFARRERERLQGSTLDALLEFWRRQLAGAPPTLDLPTDRPAPAHPTHGGDLHRFRLTGAIADAIRNLARSEQATPFMALFAGFAALLYRYSRQEDLLIGVPTTGRELPEIQPLVGLFVNIVAVRARPRADLTFRELLSQVRSSMLASLAHQELPFKKVVEAVQPKHTAERPPLVQVIHLHQAFPLPDPGEAPELTIEPWEVHPGFSRFDLALRTEADSQGFACQLEYSTDLYGAETVAGFAQHYQALLEAATARPDLPLAELPLVSAAATGAIIACGPSAQDRIVLAGTIHEAFAAQAVRTPSAMAVTDAVSALEYGDLDARAEALADELATVGCVPGTPIGLAMAPAAATVVGLLGILKAGCACVPLDPDDPPARQLRLLAETGARTVLAAAGEVEEDLRKRLPSNATATLLAVPHAAATAATRTSRKPRRDAEAEDGRRVALILPADSTADGRPLAVALGHAQILARVAAASGRSELRPGARHALVPPLTALAVVGGILEPLLTGGEVHLMSIEDATAPARCGRRLREGRFDVLHAAPSQAAGLLPTLEASEAQPRHCLLLDGEDVTPDVAARLRMLAPGLLTLCRRTPPETAGVGLEDEISASDPAGARAPADSTPRSRPMPGSVVCIVDRSLRPVPRGVPGEICLGGGSVAPGYVGRAAETSDRFVTVRLPSGETCRFFRTGETGRLRPDGTVQRLQGEVDVVWTRGYRGRAGEIEAALGAQPVVARCAAVPPHAGGTIGAGWVACVEAARPGTLFSDELRRLAQALLPARLVPTAFVVLDRLPVGADGRIDRAALPRPGRVRSMLATDHLYARTGTERTLVRIWEDLFGFQGIGIHDDFFELGGNSLMASLLVGAIRDRWPVDMPLHELFESPTIANAARLIEAATAKADGAEPSIPRTPPGVPQPLSSSQEILWLIEQFDGHTAFNALAGARLTGPLDRDALDRALAEVLRRHSVLRSAIVLHDGRPGQVAAPLGPLPLAYHDLSGLAPPEAEARAAALAEEVARARIDLGAGCLARFLLARTGEGRHTLFAIVHHMASDGWSFAVLWREAATLYEAFRSGLPSPLPDPAIQFADWACWQRQNAAVQSRQTAFWQEKLRAPLPVLDLPADFSRPTSIDTERGVCPLDIPASVARPLIEIGRRAQATPFMTLLAAYATLLHRFSQQEDLLVGTPVANRPRPETRDLIGFFASLLPLRCDLTGDPSFEELLARTRQTCLEAVAAADPDWRQVQATLPPPAPGRMPVFQAFFTLGEFPDESLAAGPLTLAPFGMNVIRFSGLDLVLVLRERGGGYTGDLLYRRDLFAAGTAERFRDGLLELMAGIVACPASRLSRLPLLTDAERRRIAVDWNATAAPFPEDTCVHTLVERQARATPTAPALVHEGRTVSYAELDASATALARRLRGEGVGTESLVAVLVERSPEMVAALLAVWKAGGAYVPLDPSWPAERMAAVVRGSAAAVALSQRRWAARLAEIAGPGLRILCVDGDAEDEDAAPASGGQEEARPSNLAYVLYTSGSTGMPKGVMVEHRSVANVVASFRRTYRVGPDDRVLQQAPVAFDVSVNEVFPVLAAGGTLVIPRQDETADFDRLAALVAEERVTIMAAAPSALAELNRRAPLLGSLRLVLSGGEALSRFDVDRLLPTAAVTNGYGPTEATICATWCDLRQLPPNAPATVPIGRPLPNYRVYVLDRHLQLLPVGCPGELCIAGVGLARGYLGDPELTAARFVANPFEPGGRLYRTGDLARWRPDGQLEFLGRLDRQVKIRGCRVELGDVEAALRGHPGVQDAAVTLLPDAGDGRLVAYIVPRPDRALPVSRRLRMERAGELQGLSLADLHDGLAVAEQNAGETQFLWREIFQHRIHLGGGIRLAPGACVFDVGANVGMFSLFVGLHWPGVSLYAFEPMPPIYLRLQANAGMYGLDARLMACALGAEPGRAEFAFFPQAGAMSARVTGDDRLRELTAEVQAAVRDHLERTGAASPALGSRAVDDAPVQIQRFQCEVTTLSAVMRRHAVERIDLLKIDVEGSEEEVLRGIDDADWPRIRQIVVEVHDPAGGAERIAGTLRARGFDVTNARHAPIPDSHIVIPVVYGVRRGDAPRSDGDDGALPARLPQYSWCGSAALLTDVRGHAERVLPAHMRPAAWVLLPELPLTASGKVDAARLPSPQATRPETGVPYAEPEGATEIALAQAWAEALGIDRVGRHDSFFDLGGHSLLAAQVIQKVQGALHAAVPFRFFLETPTLERMALRIDRLKLPSAGGAEPAIHVVEPLVRFPSARAGPPVFLLFLPGGGVNEYQHLARELGAHWPVFGLQSRAIADWTLEHDSWEAVAEDAARTLRREGAGGPYRLVGFSGGGVLALATASFLERDGIPVEYVGLLDARFHGKSGTLSPGAERALGDALVGVVEGISPELADPIRHQLARSSPFDADLLLATDDERMRHFEAWLSGLPLPAEGMAHLRTRMRLLDLHSRLLRAFAPPRVQAPLHAVWADVLLPGTSPERPDWGACSAAGVTEESVAATHWSMLAPPAVREVATRIAERLRAAVGGAHAPGIREGP